MDKKDYQFIVTNLQLLKWHELVDNPTYVKDAINEEYWNAYREIYSDDKGAEIGYVIGVIVGIASALMIVAGVLIYVFVFN